MSSDGFRWSRMEIIPPKGHNCEDSDISDEDEDENQAVPTNTTAGTPVSTNPSHEEAPPSRKQAPSSHEEAQPNPADTRWKEPEEEVEEEDVPVQGPPVKKSAPKRASRTKAARDVPIQGPPKKPAGKRTSRKRAATPERERSPLVYNADEHDLTAREEWFDFAASPSPVHGESLNASADESEDGDWMEDFHRENGIPSEGEEQTGQQQGSTEPGEGDARQPEEAEIPDDDSLFEGDFDDVFDQTDAQPLPDSEDTGGDALDAAWDELQAQMEPEEQKDAENTDDDVWNAAVNEAFADIEAEDNDTGPAAEIPASGNIEADNNENPPFPDMAPEPAVARQEQRAPAAPAAAPKAHKEKEGKGQKKDAAVHPPDIARASTAIRMATGSHKVFSWQGMDQKAYLESVRNPNKPAKRSADEEAYLAEKRFRKRLKPSGPGCSKSLPLVIDDDDDEQSTQPRVPTPNTRGATAETVLVVDDDNNVLAPAPPAPLVPAPGPMAHQPRNGHMWSGFRPPAPSPAVYPQPQQHHQPQPFPQRQLPGQSGYFFPGALPPQAGQQYPLPPAAVRPQQPQRPIGHPQQRVLARQNGVARAQQQQPGVGQAQQRQFGLGQVQQQQPGMGLVQPQQFGMGQAQQQKFGMGQAQQQYVMGGNQALPQQPVMVGQQNFGQQQNIGPQGYQQQPRYRFYTPLPQSVPMGQPMAPHGYNPLGPQVDIAPQPQGNVPSAVMAYQPVNAHPNPLGPQAIVALQAQANIPRTVMVPQLPNGYLPANGYQHGPNDNWNI